MLLVGIVIGTLFRGFSSLLQRLMEPSEYIMLQDLFFASFNQVDRCCWGISAVIVALAAAVAWRLRKTFDVLALGRDTADQPGRGPPAHRHPGAGDLLGPGCRLHRAGWPGDVLRAAGGLAGLPDVCASSPTPPWFPSPACSGPSPSVGGQLVLERVFGFDTALSVIIEFVGGMLFLTCS